MFPQKLPFKTPIVGSVICWRLMFANMSISPFAVKRGTIGLISRWKTSKALNWRKRQIEKEWGALILKNPYWHLHTFEMAYETAEAQDTHDFIV